MKKDKKHIENEVSKTMASLDSIEKASPKPFLYTRIMARMEKERNTASKVFELKQVYQRVGITALVILLVFNIITATLFFGVTSEPTTENSQEELYFDQYYPAMTTIDNLEQNINE